MRIFTQREIAKMKGDHWFYGVVRERPGSYVVGEIYPGMSYTCIGRFYSLAAVTSFAKDIVKQYGEWTDEASKAAEVIEERREEKRLSKYRAKIEKGIKQAEEGN